jgi:hypothetical protein
MSMKTYPVVRVSPDLLARDRPPWNLEVYVNGTWYGLGMLGSTQFGGPGVQETAEDYRQAVDEIARLYLAARSFWRR